MWPPDARPGGLRISPVISSPTAVPTTRSCRWMWGMARAMAEGPITHRTMVTTPNSRAKGEEELQGAVPDDGPRRDRPAHRHGPSPSDSPCGSSVRYWWTDWMTDE